MQNGNQESNIARAALDKFRQLESQVRSTFNQYITTGLIRGDAAMSAEEHISGYLGSSYSVFQIWQ